MKPPQYLITLILSIITVFLAIFTWYNSHSFESTNANFQKSKDNLQRTLSDYQREVNRGNQAGQYLNLMVQDIFVATDESKGGKRDDELKGLLSKDVESQGLTIKVASPSPSPASSSSAAPSASPTATSHN